jgi:hypothetical protein
LGTDGRTGAVADGYSCIFLKCGAPQNQGHFWDKDVDQWLDVSRKVLQ